MHWAFVNSWPSYSIVENVCTVKIEELLILRETIAKIFVMLEQILKDFVEQYDLVYDNDIAELQSKMQKFYKVNKN